MACNHLEGSILNLSQQHVREDDIDDGDFKVMFWNYRDYNFWQLYFFVQSKFISKSYTAIIRPKKAFSKNRVYCSPEKEAALFGL